MFLNHWSEWHKREEVGGKLPADITSAGQSASGAAYARRNMSKTFIYFGASGDCTEVHPPGSHIFRTNLIIMRS